LLDTFLLNTFLLKSVLAILFAFLLDVIFAEPKRWHPLVGFGFLANVIEKQLNQPRFSTISQQLLGVISGLLLILLPTIVLILLAAMMKAHLSVTWLVDGVLLYLCLGYTSLRQHGMAVFTALQTNDLLIAREKVGHIVSRDTHSLDELGVRRATIESVLENGSDAIFAPIFWFLIGGIPAVIVYRLTNTLDAMWGYKTSRFLFFGRFSARMDDILNYIPSRLVGLSYALVGSFTTAIRCWLQQAHLLASPNGGVVMAAGAGALTITLGGDSVYHGEKITKPVFGCGRPPEKKDIRRALFLLDKTLCLWLAVLVLWFGLQWLLQ
jgi:adenosylcobinamide-phosphate synthase